MLGRNTFGDRLDAFFFYASQQPTVEAHAALSQALQDGDWEKAPEEWLTSALEMASHANSPWTAADVHRRLAEALCSRPVGERPAVHLLFPKLMAFANLPGGHDLLERLVSWFVAHATAGEAAIAANSLSWDPSATPSALFPMIRWLLENGAAVLRARHHNWMLFPVIASAVLQHDPQRIGLVLRYCLVHEEPTSTWIGSDQKTLFWSSVEKALENGTTPEHVVDLASMLGTAWSWNNRFYPFSEAGFPRARRALLEGLRRNRFPQHLQREAWAAALSWLDPQSDGVASIEPAAAAAGLKVIDEEPWKLMTALTDVPKPGLAGWTALMVKSIMDAGFDVKPLEALVASGPDWRVEGVCQGLLAAGDEVTRAFMKEAPANRFMAGAAIRLLRTAARKKEKAKGDAAAIEELRAWTEQAVINGPWTEPIAGIRLWELLRGAAKLVLTPLDQEDKVRVDGDTIHVEQSVFEGIAAIPDMERRHALGAMYFLHELVHVEQGIGKKETVLGVRAAGAETLLQHLDLAADDAAARLAAATVPRWSLSWLKGIQGNSLVAYPVGPFHTGASRARKALRLASLRLDHLARERGWPIVANAGDGYLFVDFGPAGGKLLAMMSAAPFKVLACVNLSTAQAELLGSAADEGRGAAGIAAVDSVLEQLFPSQAT